jgi:DNA-binding transcriptional ArsR family regulator
MSKKTKVEAPADVDDLIGDATVTAEKPAKAKAKAPAKKAAAKPAAKKAAAKAPAKKAKAAADEGEKPAADSPLHKALLKVRKAVSYADFAEANGFNIRSVRRTARALRDAGQIDLQREGQAVFICPAV